MNPAPILRDATPADLPARAFHARMGFTEIARTDGTGNDEGLPDVQLEWRRR